MFIEWAKGAGLSASIRQFLTFGWDAADALGLVLLELLAAVEKVGQQREFYGRIVGEQVDPTLPDRSVNLQQQAARGCSECHDNPATIGGIRFSRCVPGSDEPLDRSSGGRRAQSALRRQLASGARSVAIQDADHPQVCSVHHEGGCSGFVYSARGSTERRSGAGSCCEVPFGELLRHSK